MPVPRADRIPARKSLPARNVPDRFESIFEVARHGMSREETREYSKLLGRCHRTDFFAVFGPAQ